MPSFTVYVSTEDWEALERAGEEPSKWIREMLKELLRKKREKLAEERV